MRVHRFYTGPDLQLKQDFWLHDEAMLWQWNKVLRFREGQEVILFDGQQIDRLYKIAAMAKTEAHLQMVTELERQLPKKHIYLFWSLLKKDNNDHVLQKCTELGVTNFIPIISERSIRTGFNMDRAQKIIIEASEQCGRSDIPHVREPIHLEKALDEYKDKIPLYVCEQGTESPQISDKKLGLLVGPEGGWSDNELNVFKDRGLGHIAISDHTLRAETACIVVASRLLQ
jgi:16S rRNA (uracil1498-N3)-methyltransferase